MLLWRRQVTLQLGSLSPPLKSCVTLGNLWTSGSHGLLPVVRKVCKIRVLCGSAGWWDPLDHFLQALPCFGQSQARGVWTKRFISYRSSPGSGARYHGRVTYFPLSKWRILTHGLVVKGDTRVYIMLLEHSRWSLNVRWLHIHSISFPLGIDSWDSLNFGGEERCGSLNVFLGTGVLREFIKNQFMENQYITSIFPNGDLASHQLSLEKITFGKWACLPGDFSRWAGLIWMYV